MARWPLVYRSVALFRPILLACPAASVWFSFMIASAAAAHRPGSPLVRPGRDRARPVRAGRSVAGFRSHEPGGDRSTGRVHRVAAGGAA
jgi:hypothetical protein